MEFVANQLVVSGVDEHNMHHASTQKTKHARRITTTHTTSSMMVKHANLTKLLKPFQRKYTTLFEMIILYADQHKLKIL